MKSQILWDKINLDNWYSKNDKEFWALKLLEAELQKQELEDKIRELSRCKKNGTIRRLLGRLGRRFTKLDKANLIRLQRKLKQINTTKIPYYVLMAKRFIK